MTSETTEGAGTEAPEADQAPAAVETPQDTPAPEAPHELKAPEAPHELKAPEASHPSKAPEAPRASKPLTERFAHPPAPANETAPPPPPEPANSDVENEAEAGPARGPGRAQEWPLAWLRLVEPEPPATDDDVVAAVIAAEPADAHGVAHAFGHVMDAAEPVEPAAAEGGARVLGGVADAVEPVAADGVADAFGRAMAAALDPEPVSAAEEAVDLAANAFYSVPVAESLEAASAPESGGSSDGGADAPSSTGAADDAEEKAVAEPEEPAFVTPVYAARRAAARRASAGADAGAPAEGRAGEGGLAAAAYLFCLAGFLLLPAVVGVMIAYHARRTAPAWLESHYLFLIRTFWIGLAGVAVATALLFSGVLTLGGLVIGLLLIVWLETRCALGFINIVKLRAVRRPRSWLL